MNEVIQWNLCSQSLPDDDLLVLVEHSDGTIWPAYHEGDEWRWPDGGTVGGVIAWAEMPRGVVMEEAA